MAEGVGRGALVEAGFFDVLFEHAGDASRGEASAEFVGEDRSFAACPFAWREDSRAEPLLECAVGVGTDWGEAFLLAFAADADDTGGGVDVAIVQADEFAHAEARGIGCF